MDSAHQPILNLALATLPKTGGTVIDLGCGNGALLQKLALYIDGYFLGQVTFGHSGRHVGDVAHLTRQVRRHVVHIVRQVLPDAAHVGHRGLAAELALGAHFLGHAGHLTSKNIQVVNRLVDGFGHQLEVARHRNLEAFVEVAAADVLEHLAHFKHRYGDTVHQTVDVGEHVAPEAGRAVGRGPRFPRSARTSIPNAAST